ncbi:hypothetical protein [Nocardioides sp. Leaf285]|uniref:hypothetical protein n=1 Tax=Nocardioides sp. Leaf285 TaxID=1736322 RepID=UPI00070337F7|nr:hypothetical protein [Nocardioides sp. Leaf285]KQP62992.1 hypothetical protein ASF47_18445 [Nocardioides sp. Leaf285]
MSAALPFEVNVDFWWGVATPFILVAVAAALTLVVIATIATLARLGLFVVLGHPPRGREVSPWSRRVVRGRAGLLVGAYASTDGWGSRWFAVGPLTLGLKREAWALTERPPITERTRPGPHEHWRWAGNAAPQDQAGPS